MKRILVLILAMLLCGAAVACGGPANAGNTTEAPGNATESGQTAGQTSAQTDAPSTAATVTVTPDGGETTEAPSTETPSTETPTTETPTTETPTTETPSTETPSEPTPPTADQITAVFKGKNYQNEQTGNGTVSVSSAAKLATGDRFTAQTIGHYLKVSATGVKGEFIVYLPEGVFTYTHTSNAAVYMPSGFTGKKITFTFTIPTEEELTARRNVAVNPFDTPKDSVSFPHAESNNIYDQSGQFIARNAIDGYSSNKGHGNYPYESWGPQATVRKTDYFTIDLGREVMIDEIVLYLRADGFGGSNSHDAYFSTIVLEFSDGSSVTVNPTKTADAQSFTFDAVLTSYVKLTGFITDKSDSQGWAAITEIQLFGNEPIGD